MITGDTFGLSLRNLRQSKLRTALTTLGVSIGIASLAGMLSLGVGFQDLVLGRLTQAGLFDAITVVDSSILGGPGAALAGRGGLRGGRGRGATPTPSPKLDDETLKKLAALDNVLEVYPNLRVPVELKIDDFSRTLTASGIPMSSKGQGAFQTFSYGTFFASDSDASCMLTLDMAKQITEQDPGSLIGKTASLSYASSRTNIGTPADVLAGLQVQRVETPCRIAGIVERDPGGIPGGGGLTGVMIPMGMAKTMDAQAIVNLQTFLRDPSQAKSYGAVTVKVKQARFTQDVEDKLRGMGYTVFSINDALRGAKTAFIVLDIFLSLIGSIALAVSSLGIVNTMVMSILERTREIGIMKAIGASDNDIRKIFLIEASVIGLMGGSVGVGIGWIVGKAINFGGNIYIRSQGGTPSSLFSFPLWLAAASIAFSIAVSLIAGSYPASRAARLDPIQALRHD
jgi:putative ABC transport system permease protein